MSGTRRTSRRRRSEAIRGYTQAPNVVLMDIRLSDSARWIYLLLKYHDRPGKGYVWPGQERLAKEAGWQTPKGNWDRSRVQRALEELRDAGLIWWERPDKCRTNRYYFHPLPDELPHAMLQDALDGAVEKSQLKDDEAGDTLSSERASNNSPSTEDDPREMDPEARVTENLAGTRVFEDDEAGDSAPGRCASDAHASGGDSLASEDPNLRVSARQVDAVPNENLGGSAASHCARRSTSSLRGVGSSSSCGAQPPVTHAPGKQPHVVEGEDVSSKSDGDAYHNIDERNMDKSTPASQPGQNERSGSADALEDSDGRDDEDGATTLDPGMEEDLWKRLLDSAKAKHVALYALLCEGSPCRENGTLFIEYEPEFAFHKDRLKQAQNLQRLRALMRTVYGEEIEVGVRFRSVDGRSRLGFQEKVELVRNIFEGRIVDRRQRDPELVSEGDQR